MLFQLLQDQMVIRRSEHKWWKCSVKQAFVNVFHKVTFLKFHVPVRKCENTFFYYQVVGIYLHVHGDNGIVFLVNEDTPLSISFDCSES